ncbi:MAG: hypothetical protein UX20_C0050G0006 [Candidatus Magasanikbacteria bacterium GW2011_GWC2_45_8]|uniref:Chaperone protein DnaJ n=1 Tax=Candidatus Magasanikbacteria bacterium GW2011_GWC2_45_8 TaxID=1619050 RepID=A0A0G1QV48_9BACT|nr:MAG: hypothetical protein UX20_C0050G0006 [Candidatus Magasanikbacteria bacterium GW2011_GWC2_45_8]
MGSGIFCYECFRKVGAVDAMPDGTAQCQLCAGSGEIIKRATTVPCLKCKGRGQVTKYLCSACWSLRIETKEDLGDFLTGTNRISMSDAVECSQGWKVNVDGCESKYVTARATDRKESPCFSCKAGKALRARMAREIED